jgi:hypothetical protein
MEKICTHCNENLDVSLFHKHKQTKDGFGSWCKKCLKQRSQDKRREQGIEPKRVGIDPEKRKISNLNYRKRKAESFIYAITEKICSHCKENKTVDCFKKDITGSDGYQSKCKKCQYEISTDSRKAYVVKNWAKLLFLDARHHSKYDFDIDEQFVSELYEKQNGRCYWFNVKLEPSNIAKYPWQPSLDRLDREKGYTKDNVVLACYSANIGRNTCTDELFSKFVEDLRHSLCEKEKEK